MAARRSLSLLLLSLLALAFGIGIWLTSSGPLREREEPLGLFTSLPIYWGESGDLAGMLDGSAEAHWARMLIERRRDLMPLDVLSQDSLARFDDLLVAQPRALSPAENVALDGWVRQGGRLLLFADPLLTQHSSFAIGDRRRPQDVVLLSPLLAHWGLELQFDEGQQEGERSVEMLGGAVPIELAGHFVPGAGASDGNVRCRLLAGGVAADCIVGEGRALILADAALLDGHAADLAPRASALSRLMAGIYRAG